ncbi:hypothetical protein C1893_05105 [Pseudomonas sp. MPR-ANC1]|nr:hypothetical protein C1893_05105 [Pseudomonas sp. MPR-ANC1]
MKTASCIPFQINAATCGSWLASDGVRPATIDVADTPLSLASQLPQGSRCLNVAQNKCRSEPARDRAISLNIAVD